MGKKLSKRMKVRQTGQAREWWTKTERPGLTGVNSMEVAAGGCPLPGRRQFLYRLGLAGGAVLALNSGMFSWSARKVMGAPVMPGDGAEKPRIMVGFARPDIERFYVAPGAGYPLPENQQLYTDILTKAAEDLGVVLDIEHAPLNNIEAVNSFLEHKADHAHGALLVHMATRDNPEIRHFLNARPGEMPTIIYGPQGTRTWLIESAPRCFIGVTENVNWLATALRILKAQWQMSNTRLAVITGTRERVERLEPLGSVVHHMPLQWLRDAMHASEDSEEAREIAALYMKNADAILEPAEKDIISAARNYIANRQLMKETGVHAVTTDCLGLVREGDGSLVQCFAYCIMLDEGTCGGCEADVFPALTCLLSSYLLDKPGFMSNPSLHTVTNEYVGFHCQVPTRMDGFKEPPHPYKIRPHHETQQGVTLQIDFRENQPATLWRFLSPESLGVDTGIIRRSVRPEHHEDGIGGCQNGFAMAVDGVDDIRKINIYTHPVMTYGNHRNMIRAWCNVAGIEIKGLLL